MLELKNDLSVVYEHQGHFERKESLLREAVGGHRLKLGDTHTQNRVTKQPNRPLQILEQTRKSQPVASQTAATRSAEFPIRMSIKHLESGIQ